MRIEGASIPVTIKCYRGTEGCAGTTTIQVDVDVFDSRGVTVQLDTATEIARLLPDGWYVWQDVPDRNSVTCICETCRTRQRLKICTWHNKLIE